MAYPFARLTFLPFLRYFIRSINGIEHLPKKGPFILACHHTGPLDGVFIVAAVVPHVSQKVHFISNIAPWGRVWKEIVAERWGGCIPFDKANKQQCLTIAREYLGKKQIVGIFPGGLLNTSEREQRHGKTGVARLALWSRAPVIPVGLHNFKTIRRRVMIMKQILHPHNIRINFGKPLTFPEAYNKPHTHELLRYITAQIITRIYELNLIK